MRRAAVALLPRAGAAAGERARHRRDRFGRPEEPPDIDLTLRALREDEEEEFLRAHRATTPDVPSFLHYYEEGMAFRRYLQVLAEQEQGVNVPPGHVPTTFLFAVAAGRVVGRLSLRHTLNPFLLRAGGHIGYAVVPEFRRRGAATAILQQALGLARGKLGLPRVLVTCDDDNAVSRRVIEKSGGVLEDVVAGPDLPKPKRRYWIETPTVADSVRESPGGKWNR